MDSVHVLNGRDIRRFEKYRRRWMSGWVVAGLLALVTTWAVSRARAFDNALVQVDRVHAEQVRDREALVKAWSGQQKETAEVLQLGAILRERQEQTEYNQTAVVDLTGKNKPWAKK